MNKSESITNLAKALSAFQSEIQNPKNTADNPFYKSKYCPLNDVLNLVRPLLSKHGLSVLQSPSGNGSDIIISSILMHSSGEWIEPDPLILKADKPTAQGAGSAITYGRRYSLSAMLGVSSEDDDDGIHATGKTPITATGVTEKAKKETLKELLSLISDRPAFDEYIKKTYQATAPVELTEIQAQSIINQKKGATK